MHSVSNSSAVFDSVHYRHDSYMNFPDSTHWSPHAARLAKPPEDSHTSNNSRMLLGKRLMPINRRAAHLRDAKADVLGPHKRVEPSHGLHKRLLLGESLPRQRLVGTDAEPVRHVRVRVELPRHARVAQDVLGEARFGEGPGRVQLC